MQAFAGAYSAALQCATDSTAQSTVAKLLEGVKEELRLHQAYAAEWEVDLQSWECSAATKAYTGFLLGVCEAQQVVCFGSQPYATELGASTRK